MPRLVLLLAAALCFDRAQAQAPGKVYVISLDGFGFQAFTTDPAAAGMKTLKKLAGQGVLAPMQAAFPSLTAPGHASLFTGVYGNENGITANAPLLLPRSAHRFTDRGNGFRSESLRAEMFYLKAARAGIPVVAHNVTQGFPCNAYNAGPNIALFNGYQTEEVTPQQAIRGKDVTWLAAPPEGFVPPKLTRLPVLYFAYTAGRVRFAGAVYARGLRYDTIRMTAFGGKRYVDADLHDAELAAPTSEPKARPLARFFSEALPVADITAVHFRLFDLATDGKEFLLYQTQGKAVSLCVGGTAQDENAKRQLLATAGAFIGNGAGALYTRGDFGAPRNDGLAERRFLETLELHARQTMRHTKALEARFQPRLLIDYLSTPDDMLHLWWGYAVKGNAMLEPYRRWGYQIIDRRIRDLAELLGQRDHLIVVSDHGMTMVDREVRPNVLLEEWGLSDRVSLQDHFFVLNRDDWREGLLDAQAADAVLKELRAKLETVKDPQTGVAVFSRFYTPAESGKQLGIGGESGGDLYFDTAPGYKVRNDRQGPALHLLEEPLGEHGPLPLREDLLATFLAVGPNIKSRQVRLRTVDVAPLLLEWLGL